MLEKTVIIYEILKLTIRKSIFCFFYVKPMHRSSKPDLQKTQDLAILFCKILAVFLESKDENCSVEIRCSIS